MSSERGIVIDVDGNYALVKTIRTAACESCASKEQCSTGDSLEMTVTAINKVGAEKGDEVVIFLKTATVLKFSFLVYIFPVLFLLIGAVLGEMLSNLYALNPAYTSIVLGFTLFIISFLIIRMISHKSKTNLKNMPQILNIIIKHH